MQTLHDSICANHFKSHNTHVSVVIVAGNGAFRRQTIEPADKAAIIKVHASQYLSPKKPLFRIVIGYLEFIPNDL